MNIIVCLDASGGMMFNGRRQSRDSLLINDLVKTVNGSKLYAAENSLELFENAGILPESVNDPAQALTETGYYFAESFAPDFPFAQVNTYIIYLWNRKYPADVSFNFDLSQNGYTLMSSEDFVGSSHDKITKEVWTK